MRDNLLYMHLFIASDRVNLMDPWLNCRDDGFWVLADDRVSRQPGRLWVNQDPGAFRMCSEVVD